MGLDITYTFICLAENQVGRHVDIQALQAGAYRAHAFRLLREHASCQSIEVRRDDKVVDLIARDGLRALALPDVVDKAALA